MAASKDKHGQLEDVNDELPANMGIFNHSCDMHAITITSQQHDVALRVVEPDVLLDHFVAQP
eukprot:7038266-Alexandrium_andersonii.AAC.1